MRKEIKIAVVATMLLVIAVPAYLFIPNYIKEKREEKYTNYMPYINSTSLPYGVVGKEYSATVIGSMVGAKGKLSMKAENLPEGFKLGDCTTVNNVNILEKPNSLITCTISGKSNEVIYTEITIEIEAKNFYSKAQNIFDFRVLESEPEE